MGRRERMVQDTFVSLADTLASDYDIGEFLYLLVERCGEVLDASTAGVMLESASDALGLAAGTSDEMKALKVLEMEHRQGPCLEAYCEMRQVPPRPARACGAMAHDRTAGDPHGSGGCVRLPAAGAGRLHRH